MVTAHLEIMGLFLGTQLLLIADFMYLARNYMPLYAAVFCKEYNESLFSKI